MLSEQLETQSKMFVAFVDNFHRKEKGFHLKQHKVYSYIVHLISGDRWPQGSVDTLQISESSLIQAARNSLLKVKQCPAFFFQWFWLNQGILHQATGYFLTFSYLPAMHVKSLSREVYITDCIFVTFLNGLFDLSTSRLNERAALTTPRINYLQLCIHTNNLLTFTLAHDVIKYRVLNICTQMIGINKILSIYDCLEQMVQQNKRKEMKYVSWRALPSIYEHQWVKTVSRKAKVLWPIRVNKWQSEPIATRNNSMLSTAFSAGK